MGGAPGSAGRPSSPASCPPVPCAAAAWPGGSGARFHGQAAGAVHVHAGEWPMCDRGPPFGCLSCRGAVAAAVVPSTGAGEGGRSIHRILRIETTLSQKGCRARQAGGWQAWAMRAPRPRKACFVLFFVLFRFKVGFMKLVGLRALIFFLFRMFFLNITGFSLVC